MLQAALLGFDGDLDCGEPQSGDGDSEPNTDRHTPDSLAEALDALEADAAMAEAMGSELVRAHLALRRNEVGRWEEAGDDWNPERSPSGSSTSTCRSTERSLRIDSAWAAGGRRVALGFLFYDLVAHRGQEVTNAQADAGCLGARRSPRCVQRRRLV